MRETHWCGPFARRQVIESCRKERNADDRTYRFLEAQGACAGHGQNGQRAPDEGHAGRLREPFAVMLRFEVAIAQPCLEAIADVMLFSEFDSKAAMDAYQAHPEHQALMPFFSTAREGRECMDVETGRKL